MREFFSSTAVGRFLAGEAGFLRMATQATPSGPGIEPDGRAYTADSAFATFGADDWEIADEPSISGNIFTLELKALPAETGYTFVHAQIEVDGQTRDVDYGGKVMMSLPDRTQKPFLRRHFGLPSGSTVRLRAVYLQDADGTTQRAGAWSASKSVTTTTGAASINFETSAASGTFPFGFQVLIEPIGFGVLRPWEELRIKSTALSGTEAFARMPADHPWGRTADVNYGYIAGFMFTSAGTHSVSVAVDDGRNAAVVDTVAFTASDPATVYSGDTYTVGSDGGDDYADVTALIAGIGASPTNLRIQFRGGEPHSLPNLTKGRNLYLDAIPATGTPVIDVTSQQIQLPGNTDGGDITITGLEIAGGFDVTDTTDGSSRGRKAIEQTGGSRQRSLTVNDCKIHKVGYGVDVVNCDFWAFANIEYTDMNNYFCLHGDGEAPMVALGLYCHQNPLASRANGKGESGVPYAPDHFGIRISRPYFPCCFHQSYAYCNYSWIGEGNQAFIRWAQSHGASGQMMNASMIHSETFLGAGGGDNQNTPMSVIARVDKVSGLPSVAGNISLKSAGQYVTNVHWVFPGRGYQDSRAPTTLVGRQSDGTPSGAAYVVQFSGGGGTTDSVSAIPGCAGDTTLADGVVRGTPMVRSGSFAGADAAGAIIVDVAAGALTAGEVITLDDGEYSFTVDSFAPFLLNLDPANPNREAKLVNATLVHLCDDAELDGNGTSGGIQLYDAGVGTVVNVGVYNSIVHAPNMSGGKGGTSADAPLVTAATWTPKHAGRRFYLDTHIDYTNGDGEIPRGTAVTGGTSGATGAVLFIQDVTSGSYGGGDATGTLCLENTSGTFQSGETVTGGGFSFVIGAVQTYLDGVFDRSANPASDCIILRPGPGSAATGAAATTGPVALDDFFGTLRGVSPSRGALEPG